MPKLDINRKLTQQEFICWLDNEVEDLETLLKMIRIQPDYLMGALKGVKKFIKEYKSIKTFL